MTGPQAWEGGMEGMMIRGSAGVARLAGLALLAALMATACASNSVSFTPTAGATVRPRACEVEDRYFAPFDQGGWERDQRSPVFYGCSGAAGINATVESTIARWLGVFVSRANDVAPSERPSKITVTYTIAYSTPELLSVRMVFRGLLGAARPSTIYVGLNFLVSDGMPIPLESLFTDTTDGLIALSTRSRELLAAQLGVDGDFGLIYGGTSPKITSFDRAWAFTTVGLEITFQEYQVGSYDIGAPVVVIPWSDLASVIAPSGPAAGFVR
jgi:hypothetical protein